MIDNMKSFLITFASMCLLCHHPIAVSADNTIWQGNSGGLDIHWTKADITAHYEGKMLFSAKKDLAQKSFEREVLDYSNTGPVCEYTRTLALLSVVGTIASMKDMFEQHCQGFIHGFHQFTTVDLTNLNEVVKLTDLFPESLILEALLADKLIKKALKNDKTQPSTLATLFEAVKQNRLIIRDADLEQDCHFKFPENALTQFAFHHLNNNQVAVRLALLPSSANCQWSHTQIGIYLPIPPSLKWAFKQAKENQAGFLMENQKSKQKTPFYFSTDTYTPYPAAGTRVTTINKARLRSTPQINRTNLIDKLEKGTVLNTLARSAFEESSKRYNKDYWYLVELESGKIGWIFGALTKITQTNPLMTPKKVIGTNVIVRSEPTKTAHIIDTLDKGIIVHAFARSKSQDNIAEVRDYWYQVKLENGKIGWIFGGLLMETGTKLTMAEIPVYAAPQQGAEVIDTFEQNAHLYIYGRSKHQDKIEGILDYWYQVGDSKERNKGIALEPKGWVFGGQLMRIGARITTASKVRMRKAPNLKAKVIEKLTKGVVVNALARSPQQDEITGHLDYWYQVQSESGNIGWIFGGLLMSIGFSEIPVAETDIAENETLDCRDPDTNPAINECARRSYEAAERKRQALYQQLIFLLDSQSYHQMLIEMESPLYPPMEQKKLLKKAQKNWLRFREQHCTFVTFFNRGGTGFTAYESECLEQVTKQRITTLKSTLTELKNIVR
jgi:uncharacterized protein YecT (DUF1311 family)/uncharacterized protein YgiM (DUF1202 family)